MTPSASLGDTIHGEIALFGENKGEPIYRTKVVPRVKSSYHVIDSHAGHPASFPRSRPILFSLKSASIFHNR